MIAVRTHPLIVLIVALCAPALCSAETGDGSFDIGYIWTPHLRGALDYRDLVAEQLGTDVEDHLQIVRGGSGNYGVIYDRDGTDASVAREVANAHHRILQRAFGGNDLLADVLADRGFERLHHVRYGACDDPRICEGRFEEVASALGEDAARDLVVQREADGTYSLVHRIYADEPDARAAAEAPEVEAHSPEIITASDPAVVRDSASASVAPPPEDPPIVAEPASEELVLRFDRMDQELRDAVNDHIQRLRHDGVVDRDERTAWVVYDLDADRTLVAINSDAALQCASMVKPFVALAFFHEVERGRFIYGPKSKARAEAMLQSSSNESTNWFIDQIGGVARTRKILRAHYGDMLSGVELVEKIPPGGGTYRNRASAEDYTRFLRALWRDELPHSDEIKRLMNLPNGDRIYKGVPEIPAGTAVYDKTGTTARLVGDAGILVARDDAGVTSPYVLVGIIEKSRKHPRLYEFARTRGDVIREVSGLVYDDLRAERGLR